MATSSFTKKFIIEKPVARKFVETLTKSGGSKKNDTFKSKFKHVQDSELILKALAKK